MARGQRLLLCPFPLLLLILLGLFTGHAAAASSAATVSRRPGVGSGMVRGRLTSRTDLLCAAKGGEPQFLAWRRPTLVRQSLPHRNYHGSGTGRRHQWDTAQLVPPQANTFNTLAARARLRPARDIPDCGVLNFSTPLKGEFYKVPMADRIGYQLRGCKLRTLQPAEARACFAGRHVAFVGDSLSRFQFLSLAQLLTRQRFQRPYENESDGLRLVPPDAPSVPGNGFNSAGSSSGDTGSGTSSSELRSDGGHAAWARFYDRTTQQLSQPGCVNVTCNCYRNPADHAPGEDPLSRAREYWRVRMELEDRPPAQLSMGVVYAFPDWATAGVNGLRWAFSASRRPPDVVVFNMGLWWGYLQHGRVPPETSVSRVVAAFEEIFHWGQRHVQEQGLRTRLVYKSTTPVADPADNFWWKVWPTRIEPMLMHLARTYGWEVFDAREIVNAAHKQSLVASWDPMHLLPYMYELLNDLLLNGLCHPDGGWATRPSGGLRLHGG